MRLAAKRNNSAGAAAAAGRESHDEDVHEEDGDQPQLQNALQESNEGESDEEQGSGSSSSSSKGRIYSYSIRLLYKYTPLGSSDNESSSSDEDGPAGKPPAAGTNCTPGSRGAMAVPAAAYSRMLLDELRAACVEFKLRPQPRRKQVCVAAAGLGKCSDAPDVVRKQSMLFRAWQHQHPCRFARLRLGAPQSFSSAAACLC
jgi:hypothetical protein